MLAKRRKIYVVMTVAVSFLLLAAGVIYLGAQGLVTSAMSGLLLVGLVGVYVGFCILYATYRLVNKLD